MAGESELLVARVLGHKTTEMVRRHYGRFIKQGAIIQLRRDYSGFAEDPGKKGTGS